MDFRSRATPSKLFDAYTPTELALKRATVDDKDWAHSINIIIGQQTGRPLDGNRLDLHFRQYINKHFPLQQAHVNDFENYVLQEELKTPAPPAFSRNTQLWHSSHPHGQQNLNYPSMNHRDEPDSFDLLRYR